MGYGRKINSEQESEVDLELPRSSDVSIWRRWWAGMQVAVFAPSCIYFAMRITNVVNTTEWTNDILRGVVTCAVMAAVVVAIGITTYEAAFLIVVRPWYKKHALKFKGNRINTTE